jgi:hypothetical protein
MHINIRIARGIRHPVSQTTDLCVYLTKAGGHTFYRFSRLYTEPRKRRSIVALLDGAQASARVRRQLHAAQTARTVLGGE